MIAQALLVAHLVMCAYIVWSVFARARWLDDRALPGVRLVFCILGAAALLGMAWPIARHWTPDAWSLAMLASVCLVQRTTAAKWKDGVPEQFLCACWQEEEATAQTSPRGAGPALSKKPASAGTTPHHEAMT